MKPVLLTVLGFVACGVLVFLFAPLRARMERLWMRIAKNHGLQVVVSTTPEQLRGVASVDSIGMSPEWLLSSIYYVPWSEPPGDGPEGGADAWWEWAHRYGGQDLSWTHVLVQIQATQDRNVLLEMPRVIRQREEVTSGSRCGPEGLGGNGLRARQFRIELDDEPVQVQYEDADSPDGIIPHFPMRKFDSEAFVLVAHAEEGMHSWYVEIPCIVDGVRFVLTAKPKDGNFVTVGRVGLRGHFWVSDEQRWMRSGVGRPRSSAGDDEVP